MMSEDLERDPSELRELTADETDLVSGGCGKKCCLYTICTCGGD